MAGREGCLVPDIEQRDFLAQQQRATDLRGRDGGYGHGWGSMGMAASFARLRLPVQPEAKYKGMIAIVIASGAKQSIEQQSKCGLLRCARNDEQTHHRDLAACFFLREVLFYSRPSNKGRRECRATDAPDSHVCNE